VKNEEGIIFQMRKLISILLLLPFVCGCYVSEDDYKKLKEENEKIKIEIQTVKAEFDEFRFGAARTLSEIKKDIENKNWSLSEQKINGLISRHPIASETEEAKELLLIVKEKIQKRIEEMKKEKEKQEKELQTKKEGEEREKKEKIERAVKSMNKKTDQVENITWYKDKSTDDHSVSSCLYMYFGQKENRIVGPRFYVRYGGDDWLFVQKLIFKVDEENIEVIPLEVKRDNSAGKIWEWIDIFAEDDTLSKIKKICSGKKVILRYEGRDYYKDRTIPESEKNAIQRVLDAMDALKEAS